MSSDRAVVSGRPLSWRTLRSSLGWLAVLAVCALLGTADGASPIQRDVGFEVRAFAITGARLVLSPEEEIERGTLVIRDGLIVAADKDAVVPPDAEVIDGTGLIVYPGFIDAGASALVDAKQLPPTAAGRTIDFARFALAATPPDNRKSLSPQFEAATALKQEPALLEARRKLGFTSFHALPVGRVAAGQGAHVSTSGGPVRESVVQSPTFPVFSLVAPKEAGYPATMMGAVAHLRQTFLDAVRHRLHVKLYEERVPNVARPPEDATLDVLGTLVERRSPALFVAHTRDEILRALDFAGEQNLPTVIWGGREAHRCLERLTAEARGVIVQLDWGKEPAIEKNAASDKLVAQIKDPQRVQQAKLDLWRERVQGLSQLYAQKVRFACSSEGMNDPADVFVSLRAAIKAGLPRQAALAALTRDAAVLLGQEQRLGTLTPGKLAHVTVLNGPFDDERSKVRYLFVDGAKFQYHKTATPVPTENGIATPLPNLDGTWQIEIEAADGKLAATLQLRQNGAALTGLFESRQGNGKVSTGKLDGSKLDFVVTIGLGAQEITLKFEGQIDDAHPDKLAGTLRSAFGAATSWTATRQPMPQAASANGATAQNNNPVKLELDEDSDDAKPNVKTAENSGTPATPPKRPESATPATATPATPAGTPPAHPAPTAATPGEQPTELESDRVRRNASTGGRVLIRNGSVLMPTGEFVKGQAILVQGGKITAIGPDLQPEEGMMVIDATNRYVMPGVIDTHSHIMFADGLGGVNEWTLSIVPEVRVRDVLRSNDVAEYRALAGGVTAVRLLHGSANVIGGQDAVVKLKYGEPIPAHLLTDNPQGVKFALGENVKFQTDRFPNTRLGVEATLNRAFMEALDYRRQWTEYNLLPKDERQSGQRLPPRRDLRLEALSDIIEQQKFIHSHCYRADEILMLLRVASSHNIRVQSLQHVLEGYKVAPEIVAHGASCSTFSDWWAYKVEAFDATAYNAAALQQAGANVVIKSDDPELIRHLPFEAAKTLRYGNVSPAAALKMVTLNPARELGLTARMGSIEVGKDADLAIFSGHPLSAFARCEQTLIDGELHFVRQDQPSAMSPEAAARSAVPPELSLAPADIRNKRLTIAESPSRQYAITNAVIHPVDAPDIERGTILINGEKIVGIGADLAIPPGTQIVDAAGLHAYPGLIDAGTVLGLQEIGKVRETHDFREAGLFQPDLRAGVAINPDSELIPVSRAGGITTALIRPTGGIVAGQCSVMQLDGWTAPEMVLNYEAGLQILWPGKSEQAEQLREFFEQGRVYSKVKEAARQAQVPAPIADPRYEALAPYLSGARPVFIEANSRQEIAEALLFAEEQKIKIIITGGADAWKLAGELRQREVDVIVGPIMRSPVAEYDPFDAPYANPGRLHEAGVRFCIRSNNGANSRNAPLEAGIAVGYGLPAEEALKAVTLNAARILQLDAQLGSLTVSKRADLILTDGSPLQPSTQIKAVFIAGRPHAPESRQTRLYEKYLARLKESQGPVVVQPPAEAR